MASSRPWTKYWPGSADKVGYVYPMPTDIQQTLTRLGLTDAEARLYLSMLKMGPQPVQAIAREARVSRTAAYDVIESLVKRGLVASSSQGLKKAYVAEDPEKLESYFVQRIKMFESELDTLRRLAPELRVLQGGLDSRPRVRFLSGAEGFKALFRDVEMVAPRELLEITNIDAVYEYLDRKIVDEARSVINYERTIVKLLHKGTLRRKSKHAEYRTMLQNITDFQGDIWIYANRIAFINFMTRIEVVIIDNQVFTDSMRALFYSAWNISPESKL